MASHLDPACQLGALEVLGRYLGGEELAVSAPNARLPHARGIAPASSLRELPAARVAFELPCLLAWRPDPRRPVGWFASGPYTLAVGFEDGLIAWATLAPAPAEWSWEEGQAQTLADLAYTRWTSARTWLEAAHERLYGEGRPLLTLPEAAFGCAGSTACCRIDFRIEVDPAYQELLDALPELGGERLPVGPRGQLEVKQDGRPCRFLAADGKCRVHAALGRQPFPPCALFPFSFAHTPDGLAVAASAICGSARANLGPPLAARAEDLRQRAATSPVPPLRTPVYRLAEGRVVGWPQFLEAETRLLALLAGPGPLEQRLWDGTWILEGKAPSGSPGHAPADQLEAVRVFLAPFLEAVGCLEQAPTRPEWRCEAALVPVLKNLMFSKVISFHFDLATSHNLGIVLALVAAHLEARHGTVPEQGWQALGRMFMHGAGLGFLLGDDARPSREMLAAPAFGRWLLCLTQA